MGPVRAGARPDPPRSSFTYRLTLSYVGTGLAGWQRQPNAVSVQQLVEEALARVVGEEARVFGASRTDAGVHAAAQEAHVALGRAWPARPLVAGVNHHLPPAVRVLRAAPAAPDFDARAWAVGKEYHYRMSRRSVLSPFAAPTTLRVAPGLDLERFRLGARALEGRHDFGAFARSGGSHSQTWRRVFAAELSDDGPELRFRIVGDGFLRGMVRALVGSLLWVARGQLPLERFERLLAGGSRAEAGPSAPAHGLVLERVIYPDQPGPW